MMLTIEVINPKLINTVDKGALDMVQEAPSWKGKEPVRVRFGKRLHNLRQERGYTQMQLAMNAGLDRSFISDIERGVKEPTISTLDMLALCFNLTLSQLFEGV